VNLEPNARECVLQALLDQGYRKVSYIDTNPFAPQLLCGVDARATSAERIEDDIAFGRTGCYDPLQERLWLLGRVT
jgi:hypothetical protein